MKTLIEWLTYSSHHTTVFIALCVSVNSVATVNHMYDIPLGTINTKNAIDADKTNLVCRLLLDNEIWMSIGTSNFLPRCKKISPKGQFNANNLPNNCVILLQWQDNNKGLSHLRSGKYQHCGIM